MASRLTGPVDGGNFQSLPAVQRLRVGEVRRVLVAVVLLSVLSACTTAQSLHHASSSVPATMATSASSVFYLQPSGEPNTLVAYDWAGHRVRSVDTAVPVQCCVFSQSPDGSRLFDGDNILNDQGQLLGTTQLIGTWADDNRHWCAEANEDPSQPLSGGGILEVVGPEPNDVRRVAEVGNYASHGGPGVAVCDLDTHRAVVIESALATLVKVDDVDLSTGEVTSVLPTGLSNPCSTPLVVSGDGTMVAGDESTTAGDTGFVCSLKTHQVDGHFNGQPEALSSTGTLVVTQVISPSGFALQVVDWRTGATLWRGPTVPRSPPWVSAFDEPGGDAMALTVTTETSLGTGAAVGLLVRPNAKPIRLATNVTQGVE